MSCVVFLPILVVSGVSTNEEPTSQKVSLLTDLQVEWVNLSCVDMLVLKHTMYL